MERTGLRVGTWWLDSQPCATSNQALSHRHGTGHPTIPLLLSQQVPRSDGAELRMD